MWRYRLKIWFIIGTVIVVVVVLGAIVVLAYGIKNSSSSSVSTMLEASQKAYGSEVSGAFASHLLFISSRNLTEVLQEYQPNATVVWEGISAGYGGVYNGTAQAIPQLYDSFISECTNLAVKNSTFTDTVSSGVTPANAVINATVSVNGYHKILGNISAVASVRVQYVLTSTGAWQITYETWNYLQFNASKISG
jgi:hypothetical protein